MDHKKNNKLNDKEYVELYLITEEITKRLFIIKAINIERNEEIDKIVDNIMKYNQELNVLIYRELP